MTIPFWCAALAYSQNRGNPAWINRGAGESKKCLQKKCPTGFLFDLTAYCRPPLIDESFVNQVTNVSCLMLGIHRGKGTQAELFALAIDFLLVRSEELAIEAHLAEDFPRTATAVGFGAESLWTAFEGNLCQDRSIIPKQTKNIPP